VNLDSSEVEAIACLEDSLAFKRFAIQRGSVAALEVFDDDITAHLRQAEVPP
jgi:hypothetical protein